MMPMRVTVTAEHLTLLRAMCVDWQDVEHGAPAIDPKRPYGNSDVVYDMARILGVPMVEVDGGEERLRKADADRLRQLHSETEAVLQVVLQNLPDSLAGEYRNASDIAPYGRKYVPEEPTQ